MILGIWAGYASMVLGASLLIPVSFTFVLIGVSIKGPGYYTVNSVWNKRNSGNRI
jgi:hypothetical protein